MSPAPDVRQLRQENLSKLDFPGGRGQDFRVFIQPAVHEQIWKHGTENTAVEICGVLVGQWGTDGDGPFVLVSASIRGEAASSKFAEVTFTHETWSKINAEMDSRHANLTIVGWYHTHPNFGIFLSDRDRFIQENFFSSPGQIALVLDPIQKIEGVFIWRDGKTALASHYWVGNRLQTGPASSDEKHAKPAEAAPAATGISEAASRSDSFSISSWIMMGLQFVLVFLLGYLAAGNQNAWISNRLKEEAVALTFLQFGLRPGLEEHLTAVRSDIKLISEQSAKLSGAHLQLLAKDAAADKDQSAAVQAEWRDVRARLSDVNKLLERIELSYCLSPGERARYLEALRYLSTKGAAPELTQPVEKKALGEAAPGKKGAESSSPAADDGKRAKPPAEKKNATPEKKKPA